MKTIYKYRLFFTPVQTITVPRGAELLHLDSQGDKCFIWAKIDREHTQVDDIEIKVVATGDTFDDTGWTYLSTLTMESKSIGAVVLHFFKREG